MEDLKDLRVHISDEIDAWGFQVFNSDNIRETVDIWNEGVDLEVLDLKVPFAALGRIFRPILLLYIPCSLILPSTHDK